MIDICKSVALLAAERKLPQVEEEYELPFCPVIKEECWKTCICYEKAQIVEGKTAAGVKTYAIAEPLCSHVMINGIISVEVDL